MKIFLSLILMVGSLFGQTTGVNVVNILVQPSTTIAVATLYTSGNLQNIGQTNHTVTVTAIGSSSAAWRIDTGAIQGSMDGVYWFSIGPSLSSAGATSGIGITLYGYGSFPYLRTSIQVDPLTNGTITFTINYVGTSIPVNSISDTLQSITKMQVASITMNNGSYVVGIPASTTRALVVYGFSYSLESGITALQFGCGNGSAFIGSGEFFISANPNGVTQHDVYSQSLRPYGGCSVNENLAYEITGTGTHSYLNVFYRYE